MENASKALLISGGVLIAILVISIGVYLFTSYSDIGSSYEQNMSTAEIQKFNVNFTKFEGRDDITIHEIVTLVNFAKQYKEQTGIHVSITMPGKGDLINWLNNFATQGLEDEKIIEELIKNNLDKKFECLNENDNDIKYDNYGKVKQISFQNT